MPSFVSNGKTSGIPRTFSILLLRVYVNPFWIQESYRNLPTENFIHKKKNQFLLTHQTKQILNTYQFSFQFHEKRAPFERYFQHFRPRELIDNVVVLIDNYTQSRDAQLDVFPCWIFWLVEIDAIHGQLGRMLQITILNIGSRLIAMQFVVLAYAIFHLVSLIWYQFHCLQVTRLMIECIKITQFSCQMNANINLFSINQWIQLISNTYLERYSWLTDIACSMDILNCLGKCHVEFVNRIGVACSPLAIDLDRSHKISLWTGVCNFGVHLSSHISAAVSSDRSNSAWTRRMNQINKLLFAKFANVQLCLPHSHRSASIWFARQRNRVRSNSNSPALFRWARHRCSVSIKMVNRNQFTHKMNAHVISKSIRVYR